MLEESKADYTQLGLLIMRKKQLSLPYSTFFILFLLYSSCNTNYEMAFEDSIVCIYEYEGGFNPIPAPPLPAPDASPEEIAKQEAKYKKAIAEKYPNLLNDDERKYIPIHERFEYIVNSDKLYHASIQWDSKKCLNQKEKNELNAILSGDKRDFIPDEPAKCFLPRHAIVISDNKGNIIQSYAICFECENVKNSKTGSYSDLDISVLEKYFNKIGYKTKANNPF